MGKTHRQPAAILAALLILICGADAFAREPAPDFALKSFDGNNIRLSELRTEVVVLTFWADWCGACKEQLPDIERLLADINDPALNLLSVNLDADREHAAFTIRKMGLEHPVLFDADKSVSETYDLKKLPMTVFVDRHGREVKRLSGAKAYSETGWRRDLTRLLDE